LRVLADSYRKQCSAVELLKMFLQTAGFRWVWKPWTIFHGVFFFFFLSSSFISCHFSKLPRDILNTKLNNQV
jgi:hypothetical protein